tara:strand:- start:3784 stop:4014 length:231 start_codon:yes stop_codon:yes gene_type:complete
MTISIDKLKARQEELAKNYDDLTKNIIEGEKQIVQLKDQRNAMGGALQQVEMFIKEAEENDTMPAEKQEALNIATS